MGKILPIAFTLLFFTNFTASVSLAAATFSLSPASQIVKVGDSFDVSVKFDTGGETVKTVKASVTFPPSLLSVETDGVTTTGTAVTAWTERIYSNQAGTIELTGNTSTSGAEKLLATIKFKTKAVGTANVTLASGSQIIRSSDSSNILSLTDSPGGTYTLATTTVKEEKPKVATPPSEIPKGVGFTGPTLILGTLAFLAIILGIILTRTSVQTP